MIHFECDYACGASTVIMEALARTNCEQCSGYGEDEHCAHAAAMLRERCKAPEAAVHFVVGGTQANLMVIAAGLLPFEGVLCAHTGHIHVHETGAVEATGHKVLALPAKEGKITAEQIHAAVEAQRNDSAFEHIVKPGMVYLSHPTELGTLYRRDELEAIARTCRADGLKLFVDGARLVYGLDAAPEVDLPFLTRICDAFTLGGTKAGLLFGEAIIITNREIAEYFRYHIKQRGGMLAKGRLLGVQYEALLFGNHMEEMGHHANELAAKLKAALVRHGCGFLCDTVCNQIFPILPNRVLEILSEKYVYSFMNPVGEDKSAVRFCTSAVTAPSEVEALIADLDAAYAEIGE